MGEGGFKYLWEKGIVYKDAHHSHANTETIVGHATLATGAYPSIPGMVGNLWFDRARKRTVYNIEDANYHLLTPGGGVSASAEIDYTQAVAQSDGRSPNAILTTTFSDELRAYSNGRSKVFGVSVKDRGAVSLAGHAGKAFWFSKTTGDFVTSSYYYDQYPEWVEDWNAKIWRSSGVVILYRKAIPRTSFRKKTYQDTFEIGDKCGLNLLTFLGSVCIV